MPAQGHPPDFLPLDWRERLPPEQQQLLQAHPQAVQMLHMQLPYRASMAYPVVPMQLAALPVGYPPDPRLYMFPPQPAPLQQPGPSQPGALVLSYASIVLHHLLSLVPCWA